MTVFALKHLGALIGLWIVVCLVVVWGLTRLFRFLEPPSQPPPPWKPLSQEPAYQDEVETRDDTH